MASLACEYVHAVWAWVWRRDGENEEHYLEELVDAYLDAYRGYRYGHLRAGVAWVKGGAGTVEAWHCTEDGA